jgi:Spy/CpxP family protein refolding chaperone
MSDSIMRRNRTIRVLGLALAIVVVVGPATAQSPYGGMQTRAIKALSEQQIADLKTGRGMGLALPAELNGYPGPMHVLEHAVALSLTAEQRERTAALIQAMKAEAIPVGERLIAQEEKLDRLFADRAVTATSLQAATADIGATQARLRETHLKYHLAMRELLTAEQIERYRVARGYGAGAHQHRGGHHK